MVKLGLDSFLLFVSLDDQIARISRMKASIFFVVFRIADLPKGFFSRYGLRYVNVLACMD